MSETNKPVERQVTNVNVAGADSFDLCARKTEGNNAIEKIELSREEYKKLHWLLALSRRDHPIAAITKDGVCYDAWYDLKGCTTDDLLEKDHDGDEIYSQNLYEKIRCQSLAEFSPYGVTVIVDPKLESSTALRLLDKIRTLILRDGVQATKEWIRHTECAALEHVERLRGKVKQFP